MTEIMQWKIGGKMTKWMSNPPFTVFFPRRLITAQIMSWMPVSIDSRCHTFQCSPPPHKATQPCSVFRLLQCCGSEVNRFRNTLLPLPKSHWSDLTSLFKQHIVFHKCFFLKFKMGSFCVSDMCVWNLQGEKRLWVGFSSHKSAPMWTKWMMGSQTMNAESYMRLILQETAQHKCLVKQYIVQSY